MENVNHPKHYNEHESGVECIDVAEDMNFNIGNAFKYVFRAGHKNNDIEDLEKAKWYLNREKDRNLERNKRIHNVVRPEATDYIAKIVSFEKNHTKGDVLMSIWNSYYSGSIGWFKQAIDGIDKMIEEIKCQ